MKIIHFYPKAGGISFLQKFRKHLESNHPIIYSYFYRSADLSQELDNRLNHTDIVIFTAHGDEEYIIGDQVQGKDIHLTLDKLSSLKNSFVFAFSCSTGLLGKQLCSINNVISYVGFNDIIDLSVNTCESSYKDELSKILKEIYNEALQKSFDVFITHNYDIDQFSRLISINLKRAYVSVLSMDFNELCQKFNINYKRVSDIKFLKKLHGDLLTTVDAVRARIVVHGEKNFIPWFFIEDDRGRHIEIISKLEGTTYSEENEYYRYFILALLNFKIGRINRAFEYYKLAVKLYPEYEPLKIFSFSNYIDVDQDFVSQIN